LQRARVARQSNLRFEISNLRGRGSTEYEVLEAQVKSVGDDEVAGAEGERAAGDFDAELVAAGRGLSYDSPVK